MSRKNIFVLGILTMLGCSILKASPGDDSGFLPDGKLLAADEAHSPFDGDYYPNRKYFYEIKPKYQALVISPINVLYAEKQILDQKMLEEFKADQIDDLQETARFFRERLKIAFDSYPNHPMTVVPQADPKVKTLQLDLAITELFPTKALLNVLSTIAGFFLPGTGITKPFSKGSIAFEGILRDAKTQEVFVEIKDRETDKAALFSIKDFEEYAHQRKTIQEWSDQLAALGASGDGDKVDGASPVTLNPF